MGKFDRIIKINGNIADYDYAFPHTCYNCGENVGCNVIFAKKTDILSPFGSFEKYVFLGICPQCSYPALAVAEKIPGKKGIFIIEEIFPRIEIPQTPKELPKKISRFYDEFKNVYTLKKAPSISVAAGRMLLEAILKDNVAGDKPLIAAIKELADKCIIPSTLYEVAETIRTIGNKSIHEIKGITSRDADDIWDFVNIFIQYFYVLPQKIEKIKSRHK